MTNKPKGPSWFALTLDHKEILSSVDKTTGMDSILYALEYLETGIVPNIESPLTRGVFGILKKEVDKSFDRYNTAVESGRVGGRNSHRNSAR